jgi:intracellular sulfur oxidation DsrE/DsrF family protein
MKKLVIHIFHTHEGAAETGAKLSERIRLVAGERGISLELFIFGPAIAALVDPAQPAFRDALAALVQLHVPVRVCRQTVEMMGKVELLTSLGFELEYARDAFIRFALEGATVISL